jgi:hypothetical protein
MPLVCDVGINDAGIGRPVDDIAFILKVQLFVFRLRCTGISYRITGWLVARFPILFDQYRQSLVRTLSTVYVLTRICYLLNADGPAAALSLHKNIRMSGLAPLSPSGTQPPRAALRIANAVSASRTIQIRT